MPWTLIAYPLHAPCMILAYSLHTHFVLLASFATVSPVVSFFSFFLDSNLAATSITTSSLCRSFLGIATTAHMTTFNAQTGCSLALSLDSLGLTKWLDFFLELLLSLVQLLELFTPWRKCASLHVISCNQAAQKISVFNHLVPCLLTNFCQKLDLLCQHLLFLHLASDVEH